jgi:hypothetical protein
MHFRDTQRKEVDLVMERTDGGIIGVEIKASASFRLEDFRGLAALAEHAGPHFQHGVLIYTGDKVLPVKTGKQTFHAGPVPLKSPPNSHCILTNDWQRGVKAGIKNARSRINITSHFPLSINMHHRA